MKTEAWLVKYDDQNIIITFHSNQSMIIRTKFEGIYL